MRILSTKHPEGRPSTSLWECQPDGRSQYTRDLRGSGGPPARLLLQPHVRTPWKHRASPSTYSPAGVILSEILLKRPTTPRPSEGTLGCPLNPTDRRGHGCCSQRATCGCHYPGRRGALRLGVPSGLRPQELRLHPTSTDTHPNGWNPGPQLPGADCSRRAFPEYTLPLPPTQKSIYHFMCFVFIPDTIEFFTLSPHVYVYKSPTCNKGLMKKKSECLSVLSNSWKSHGLFSPGSSPGQNTGVGSFFPSPGDLPNPGIELWSPALQADSLPSELLGKPLDCKEIQPDQPKGDQSCIFIGTIDAEAEIAILWLPDAMI